MLVFKIVLLYNSTMEEKSMKKVLFIGLAAMFLGLTNVDAMTEKELRKKFDVVVDVADGKYELSAGDKKLVDDYLAKYDLSSDDCDYIAKRIDEAVAIVEKEDTAVAKNFSANAKQELKGLVEKIARNTSVKATVTNGSVVVLNSDGSTFAEVDHLVKQTASSNSNIAIIAGIAFIVTVVGSCLIVRQVRTEN